MRGVIAPVLLMAGLARTPASTASLLLNLEGLATVAIAWLVFRENVDRRLLVGAAAILGGALLLSWRGGPSGGGLGMLAIAGACFAWGIDNNLTRKLSGADPVPIAMLKGLAAGVVNLVLALTLAASLPALPVVASAALIGCLDYGVSLVMFVLALRHLGTPTIPTFTTGTTIRIEKVFQTEGAARVLSRARRNSSPIITVMLNISICSVDFDIMSGGRLQIAAVLRRAAFWKTALLFSWLTAARQTGALDRQLAHSFIILTP
ncbi:EamA family transporter [Sphingobium sp. AN558]|jgi:drug/metabolite transporter (DMT)-like permease|uniref:EamA family transporter n=1 Tax=Sphingobium sp. AN558 TaxID=3133442 RepID=UPI0040409C85